MLDTTSHIALMSPRAKIVERRTYLRPLNEEGTIFETRDQMHSRVIDHQRWLWENQLKRKLNDKEEDELANLRELMDKSLVSMSGRVKWLGGTDLVKERSSAAFNCSFTNIENPADHVDAFWLLLQGCGLGNKPLAGLTAGFSKHVRNIVTIPSTRTDKGGAEDTTETYDHDTRIWTIQIGDSARGWAKSLGKLLAGKYPAETLVLDFSQIRPGGKRLRGYGWLSCGWEPLMKAYTKICDIMMNAAERTLTELEMGEITNLLGTVLSSRRSAQMWLLDDTSSELDEFIKFKVGRYETGNTHREQSNNSIVFWNQPERQTIVDLLHQILHEGDPGFINGQEAKRRAPDFAGVNPCAEILLPSKGFCNLVQVVWHRFNGDFEGLLWAQYLAGRANYRQTCVNMKDGVLQLAWDNNQHLLRLCGVAPLGYVAWEGMDDPDMLDRARSWAQAGANSMAYELGTPRPRRVTQVQPGGTSSKHLGLEGDEVHEGAHLSLSRWIFNNISVTKGEPLLDILIASNYRVREHPFDTTCMLVSIPVEYPESPAFTKTTVTINGQEEYVEVNQESAITQLNRYLNLMKYYVDHNCSITISYDEHEIEEMADWFMENWDDYVGVSFLKRNDPTKTAEDLGFAYLPQETVSKRMYDEYVATLLPFDLSTDNSHDIIDMGDCATGACPIR